MTGAEAANEQQRKRIVPPDTSPQQILADWFGGSWLVLNPSEQTVVVAELRRYFSGEFRRSNPSSGVHGRTEQ